MTSETLLPPPAAKFDTRSVAAAGLCVAALFFNSLGWVLAIIGVFLLRRAAFSAKTKWILAAVALAPKILFVGVQLLRPPAPLAFIVEPRTLATSSTLWSWSILMVAFGVYLLFTKVQPSRAPESPIVEPKSPVNLVIKLIGLALIAGAAVLLLGLTDDFQRIEDAGKGRWALNHAARGDVATFTPDELASLAVIGARGRRGISYSVRVSLTNGRTFSASTSSAALPDLRKFATTAGLRPGSVTIRPPYGAAWTNGASGFTLKDCLGSYEYVDRRLGERSTFEFWYEDGHLAGKETTVNGQARQARMLRDIKLGDAGELEFQQGTYAAAEQSQSTMSFSFRSAQAETGRFTKDGLEIGLKKYRKL